ncbi:hypothetical protein FOA52_015736 [Chlamydomonas sp. UWO 241]|nr:hypothetical protein FOA52_015736 [Chlamydomonas sp. UWO 241]
MKRSHSCEPLASGSSPPPLEATPGTPGAPRLPPRVAVVAGVSRQHGIGRRVAERFVGDGWRVLGVDVVQQESPLVFARTKRNPHHGGPFQFYRADVSDPTEVGGLVHRLESLGWDACHCLINNAGLLDPDMPPEDDVPSGVGSGSGVTWLVARHAVFKHFVDVNLTGICRVQGWTDRPHARTGRVARAPHTR